MTRGSLPCGQGPSHPRRGTRTPGMNRFLGAVGIVGGTFLLSAFVIGIPEGLWDVRMALYLLGSIAVIIGVHRRQVDAAPTLTRVVAIAAIAANLLYLARAVVFPNSPWHPFAGDNGMVFFVAGLATWISVSAFGFVTFRLGAVTGSGALALVGALALAIGSTLAILGMDRLELTSEANPTIFAPLSLIGVALNGVGWILLGLDLVLDGTVVPRLRSAPAR